MAAITTNLETGEATDVEREYYRCSGEGGALRGLGAKQSCPTPAEVLNATHAELLQMIWARTAALDQVQDLSITAQSRAREVKLILLDGDDVARVGRTDARCPGQPDYCGLIPEPAWNPAGTGGAFSLLTWTTKMACPSFSLPSGHDHIGGACPGAVQTVVPRKLWESVYKRAIEILSRPDPRALRVSQEMSPSAVICQHCYAAAERYGSSSVQLSQLLRLIWVRGALKSGGDQFVEVMDWAVKNAEYYVGGKQGKDDLPKELRNQKYFRIHDSGDFFSKEYLRAWQRVCVLNPDVLFWAPTRIWPRGSDWGDPDGIVSQGPANMIVRPSAFRINEHGPNLGGNWAAPSTTIASAHNRGMESEKEDMLVKYLRKNFPGGKGLQRSKEPGPDPRYDWDCPAYLEDAGKHRCRDAVNIDGKKGCRVCWDYPELVVNYTLH